MCVRSPPFTSSPWSNWDFTFVSLLSTWIQPGIKQGENKMNEGGWVGEGVEGLLHREGSRERNRLYNRGTPYSHNPVGTAVEIYMQINIPFYWFQAISQKIHYLLFKILKNTVSHRFPTRRLLKIIFFCLFLKTWYQLLGLEKCIWENIKWSL